MPDTGGDAEPAEPERYVLACEDGSASTHFARFPVQFVIGDPPRAGVWFEYTDGYLASVGDGAPVAAYSPVLSLDADGYAVAACGWLGDGWMVERYTLLVE